VQVSEGGGGRVEELMRVEVAGWGLGVGGDLI